MLTNTKQPIIEKWLRVTRCLVVYVDKVLNDIGYKVEREDKGFRYYTHHSLSPLKLPLSGSILRRQVYANIIEKAPIEDRNFFTRYLSYDKRMDDSFS